jgi:hypothetical protein
MEPVGITGSRNHVEVLEPYMTKTKQTPKAKEGAIDLNLSVAIHPELKAAVERRARRDRRSMSFIVRDAIERYLEIERASAA